jgi:hypothetical protein
MHRPARPAVRFGVITLSAAMFAWVAVINGYPLIFQDSARYIDGGIRHFIPAEAPIFYGIFMIPLHWNGLSLWPVVIIQCLILAYVLRAVLRVCDVFSERSYLALSALIAVGTGAPWFAAFIMPDFFTAISILSLFVLFHGWAKLQDWERVFFIGLALIALASHVSHILVGLSLATVFILLRMLRRAPIRGAPILVASLPLIALGGVIGMNVLAKGRPMVTQDGNVFLFARAVADGPGYEYMRNHCGDHGWRLCQIYAALPRDADEILWESQETVWTAGSPSEVRQEAAEIVPHVFLEYPGEMLAAGIRNGFAQLLTFRAGVDFRSWGGDGSWPAAIIQQFFPREFSQFARSRQQRGELDAAAINRLYSVVVILSLVGSLLILVMTRFDKVLAEFLAVIAVALLANAFATGAFSSIHDRYQARIVWLLPLAFAISILIYFRRHDPSATKCIEQTLHPADDANGTNDRRFAAVLQ